MLFLAEFEMAPGIHSEEASSKVLSWEKLIKEEPLNFKIIGKYGFYGARKGFFIVEVDHIDKFYTCIKHFRDIYIWNVRPIHHLEDFYRYSSGVKNSGN
jgi:hypothetical protein